MNIYKKTNLIAGGVLTGTSFVLACLYDKGLYRPKNKLHFGILTGALAGYGSILLGDALTNQIPWPTKNGVDLFARTLDNGRIGIGLGAVGGAEVFNELTKESTIEFANNLVKLAESDTAGTIIRRAF